MITKYIVFEVQTNHDGTVSTLVNAYDNRSDAESKYHAVLSAAALSKLPVHACIMMANNCMELEHKCYVTQSEE